MTGYGDWVPFYSVREENELAARGTAAAGVGGRRRMNTATPADQGLTQMLMEGVYRLLPSWEERNDEEEDEAGRMAATARGQERRRQQRAAAVAARRERKALKDAAHPNGVAADEDDDNDDDEEQDDDDDDEEDWETASGMIGIGTEDGVSLLVSNWLDIHQFFLDAQMPDRSEAELSAELPTIEAKLRSIHRILLTERRQILVRLGHGGQSTNSGSCGPSGPSASPSTQTKAKTSVMTTTAAAAAEPAPSSRPLVRGECVMNEDFSLLLPPGYHFLFGHEDPPPAEADDEEVLQMIQEGQRRASVEEVELVGGELVSERRGISMAERGRHTKHTNGDTGDDTDTDTDTEKADRTGTSSTSSTSSSCSVAPPPPPAALGIEDKDSEEVKAATANEQTEEEEKPRARSAASSREEPSDDAANEKEAEEGETAQGQEESEVDAAATQHSGGDHIVRLGDHEVRFERRDVDWVPMAIRVKHQWCELLKGPKGGWKYVNGAEKKRKVSSLDAECARALRSQWYILQLPGLDIEPETERVYPSPVGETFLLLICQYAKHNHPPGARKMILKFLAKLLYEADFPPNRLPGGSAAAVSLLQLSPMRLVVPLLDMIRQISAILDPGGHRKQQNNQPPPPPPPQRSTVSSSSSSAAMTTTHHSSTREDASSHHPSAVAPGPSSSCVAGAAAANDGERAAFVLFLCVLAEKMERVPDLANYFITYADKDAPPHFVLLHALLPYLAHDSGSPEWGDRRDTCRYALSAVLSLAKCPDPWVRDIVAAESWVVSQVLNAACTTLVTLCKVPFNEDSRTEVLYLTDVLHFWSTFCLTAPQVATTLGLPSAVQHQFIYKTVLPLLSSPDTKVYSAACLILARLLRDVGSSNASLVLSGITEALLVTPVVNGRLNVTAPRGTGTTFLEHFILPHLSPTPFLSAEDKANIQSLGYQLTPWTGCEATLALLQAVAVYCPALFLSRALGVDLRRHKDDASMSSAIASAPPAIHVDQWFPTSFQEGAKKARRGGGGGDVRVSNAVLEQLLFIESNVSGDLLLQRDEFFNPFLHRLSALAAARTMTEVEAVVRQEQQHQPQKSAETGGGGGSWFHPSVHAAPVIAALANLLSNYQRLPTTVGTLLTGVITSVCLQPDSRVLFTVLDSSRGRFKDALWQVKQQLDSELEAEISVVTTGSAGGAGRHKKSSGSSWLWKTIASNFTDSSGGATSSSSSSSTSASAAALATAAAIAQTRKGLFDQYVALENPPDLSLKRPSGFSKELFNSLVAQRGFIEMALCLEAFRQELGAVVAYVEMSRQFMALQPVVVGGDESKGKSASTRGDQ